MSEKHLNDQKMPDYPVVTNEKLQEIAEDIRKVAAKHNCSIMELAHACIGVCCDQYFRDKIVREGYTL